MKQKPRWMQSVIEAAKAECSARPFGRTAAGAKSARETAQKSGVTKP